MRLPTSRVPAPTIRAATGSIAPMRIVGTIIARPAPRNSAKVLLATVSEVISESTSEGSEANRTRVSTPHRPVPSWRKPNQRRGSLIRSAADEARALPRAIPTRKVASMMLKEKTALRLMIARSRNQTTSHPSAAKPESPKPQRANRAAGDRPCSALAPSGEGPEILPDSAGLALRIRAAAAIERSTAATVMSAA